jgi:hypothetical protein
MDRGKYVLFAHGCYLGALQPQRKGANHAGDRHRRSSASDATARHSNGTGFWLTSYIGANRYTPDAAAPPKPGKLYPMAFLVEQDAGAVVGAHYHQADSSR